MQARLEARHLTKYYSAIPAIRDVSFTLEPGTILILLPTLIIFILFQRQIITALLQGSVKG